MESNFRPEMGSHQKNPEFNHVPRFKTTNVVWKPFWADKVLCDWSLTPLSLELHLLEYRPIDLLLDPRLAKLTLPLYLMWPAFSCHSNFCLNVASWSGCYWCPAQKLRYFTSSVWPLPFPPNPPCHQQHTLHILFKKYLLNRGENIDKWLDWHIWRIIMNWFE